MRLIQFPLWFALTCLFGWRLAAAPRPIPEALQPWETWATWNEVHRFCPTPYSDPQTHRCLWPSRLVLTVDKAGAQFGFSVTVYGSAWLPLPGGPDAWPQTVRANGVNVPILEHGGSPAVQLEPGDYTLDGSYRWNDMPQRLRIPAEIGVLELSIDGRVVEAPAWDAEGMLWLKREGLAESGEKNFLSMKIHAVLEDGIPLWLRQDVELTVSGKSREEELGAILPGGWKLSSVESPIPVAVDEAGRMKVQVRAGKWTLQTVAFRLDDPKEFRFAPEPKPAVTEELVAFRARPDFRTVEILGSPSIDVSQTTFPEKWRGLPVYRWDTATPFRLEQRLRGMGDQKPAGLVVSREWWLDEDGRGVTFRDRINGAMQQIWRLDAAAGEDLGSVRSGGQGQLITRNPKNGAAGVEIRTRNLNLEATGRMGRPREFPATGWRSDADTLRVTLNLPPGWRLFALFGADWVRGDWLTAWTLLDLFLLLILSLTVFRLWGVSAALLAFAAFGLSYHEPGAPRYLWLVLLIPLALLRVVPPGRARQCVIAGKWITVGLLVLALAPFVGRQVQQAIYPQLEVVSAPRGWFRPSTPPPPMEVTVAEPPAPMAVKVGAVLAPESARRYGLRPAAGVSVSNDSASNDSVSNENLAYDPKARIQTGPGVPEWTWRAVSFGWNGPVQASQQVRPILISLTVERLLTVVRVALVLVFAALLLRPRGKVGNSRAGTAGAAALTALLFLPLISTPAQAADSPTPKIRGADSALVRPGPAKPAPGEGGGNSSSTSGLIPDAATLELLRTRLLEVSDAYPNAADIPSVSLVVTDRRLVMEAVIHTALRTAVPLPGRLPAWSPVTVQVDGKPGAALRRDDGFLWVVLPAGVHQVHVEGLLANAADWEWTFLLKPRQVKIEAPGWTVSGVRPDGVPEQQVFFAPRQKAVASQASYERQELQTLAQVDRHVELGLIGQVRTVVTRLSPLGKAVALRVPLLPGENVLSANAVVRDGAIEVRLGAQEPFFSWDSGLTLANQLQIATRTNDVWVERWELVASPVWNVTLTGLAPFFDAANAQLVPVWQPWPGESVTLALNRPEALAGATVTVSKALHEVALGKRQRVSKLFLTLRCSLGEDFLIELPADAEITSLTQNDTAIPVRKDGRNLVIPVRPGEQTLSVGWKVNTVLGFRATAGEVRLPVESANIDTLITVPEDRWVLWTSGPQRGPAVRFWGILACSLIAAVALGRVARSPLPTWEWMLLAIGLTQVPLPAAMVVVGWLFLLVWRGLPSFQTLHNLSYNGIQVLLVGLTAVALGILIFAVGEGLLGSPEMFITGNGSIRTALRWYQDRSGPLLPIPASYSISIWWYRFLMLVWALWLAAALIHWFRLGWQHFSTGGCFRPWRTARVPQPAPPTAPPLVQPE